MKHVETRQSIRIAARSTVCIVLFLLSFLPVQTPVLGETAVSGEVSGVWDIAGSPYVIVSETHVPARRELAIDPGVEVRFDGHYRFLVHGTLTAKGSKESYILFTRHRDTPYSRGWGIRFNDSDNPSILSYCIIEHGYAENGVSDLSLDDRGGGVFVYESNVTIEDCIIRNNEATTGGGIFVSYSSTALIQRNVIADNKAFSHGYIGCGGGGIGVGYGSPASVIIKNNFIYGNTYSGNSANYEGGGGISIAHGAVTVVNNTICGNSSPKGSGIHTSQGYEGLIKNNIVYGNSGSTNGEQISIETGYEPHAVPEGLDIQYNDIQDLNGSGIVVVYRNRFQDHYYGTNNIDVDPLFVDDVTGDFHLQRGSPAIDAGHPDAAPDDDIDGGARPQDAGYDMGADESGTAVQITDGFETGDFSAFPWEHRETAWQIADDESFSGTYSATSGDISHYGRSHLTLDHDCEAGDISFAVKISSEPGYDILSFYMDGQLIEAWSGQQDWIEVSYPVFRGSHGFEWIYEKDLSISAADDAAWIDDVTLTIREPNDPLYPEGPPGMVFVEIPGGTFQMGDHHDIGESDDTPVHAVTLDGFQMSKYETTSSQYVAYLNAALADGLIEVVDNEVVYASSDSDHSQPYCYVYYDDHRGVYSPIEYRQGQFIVRSLGGHNRGDHPAVHISWYGAAAFCAYYGYRLPTEAEWEYAARGAYHDPYYLFPWGSNDYDCSMANYWKSGGSCNPLNFTDFTYPFTASVGYYGPQGAYGLCDMAGNAFEWCQDWYDSDYYSDSPTNNPTGPTEARYRVKRGGGWTGSVGYCRVANRDQGNPINCGWSRGFRVCR